MATTPYRFGRDRDMSAPTALNLMSDFFAAIAGVHLPSLRESETDRPFYTALGAFALMFAVLGGLMAMQAVSFATRRSDTWSLWWVAVLWGLMMLALERLVLQVSDRRPWALAIALIPRVAISVLVALNISSIGLLVLYKPEVDNYLVAKQTRDIAAAQHQVDQVYTPQLQHAKGEITRLKANERKVENRIAREDLRAVQSRDAQGTCVAHCQYYVKLARDDRRLLAVMHRRNVGRFAGLRAKLRRLRHEGREALASRDRAIRQQDGLAAREDALAAIKKRHPAIAERARLIAWLLIAFDLTAISAKVARVLTVKDGAYETNLHGRRSTERLKGKRRIEDARTEASRIKDEGRAARRRNKAEAQNFEPFNDVDGSASTSGVPIEGYSLTDFASGMTEWEREPTTVPPVLRRVGLIGLGLIALTLVMAVFSHTPFGALLVVLAAAVFGGWLLVTTGGFQRAPGWALRAIFLTFAAGLVLPLIVLVTNL